MRIAYAIELDERGGRHRGTCPALPEVSVADISRVGLRAATETAVVAALCQRVIERRDLPSPTKAPLRDLAAPPLLIAAKLALLQTMRERGVTNVGLARMLRTVEGSVRRLVDPHHRSHIGHVEAALAKLGKRLLAELCPLAPAAAARRAANVNGPGRAPDQAR